METDGYNNNNSHSDLNGNNSSNSSNPSTHLKSTKLIDWEQISFEFYNRKGTIASSLRKGTPYLLKIIISRLNCTLKQVRYCSHPSEFISIDEAINLCSFLRISQKIPGGQLATAEIRGENIQLVLRWGDERRELSPEIEMNSAQGIVIGIPFIFLKNRKEICDLDICSTIPSKHNSKRVYSFILILQFGTVQREYQVDIPWKGMVSERIPNKRPNPQSLPPDEETISTTPPPKKYKPEDTSLLINNAPIINSIILSVVPIMCDVALAEIQQQITSIIGQNLPQTVRLLFGSVPAAGHAVPHIFYVPQLSKIPPQFITHVPEAKGSIVLEKYYVLLQAFTEENVPISFQGADSVPVASSFFMYQGTSDIMMSRLLWNQQQISEEDPNAFNFELDNALFALDNNNNNNHHNSSDQSSNNFIDHFPITFGNSLILSEPIVLRVINHRLFHHIPFMTHEKDIFGRTLLHHVVMKGFKLATIKLLEMGFDPMLADHFGKTPIKYAQNTLIRNILDMMIISETNLITSLTESMKTLKKLNETSDIDPSNENSEIILEIQYEIDLFEQEEKTTEKTNESTELNKPTSHHSEALIRHTQTLRKLKLLKEKISKQIKQIEAQKDLFLWEIPTFSISPSNSVKPNSETSDSEAEDAELAMKQRIARRKTSLAEKQSPTVVSLVMPTPTDQSPVREHLEVGLQPIQETIRSRAGSAEEEQTMKARVVQRKNILAKKQENKKEKVDNPKTLELDPDKLAQLLSSLATDDKDLATQQTPTGTTDTSEATVPDEDSELVALKKRITDRKRNLAEKEKKLKNNLEKLQLMEREKEALEQEAAAEAASSAIKERIAERKRHLAERERTGSPLRLELQQMPSQYWSLHQLQQISESHQDIKVDIDRLEWYLTDDEFLKVFSVDKSRFYAFTKQHQNEMKKQAGLFTPVL